MLPDCEGLLLMRAELPHPKFNHFLYREVGRNWFWTERLIWTDDQWKEKVCREGFETWVLYVQGSPAGYFELEQQDEQVVEIVYFGLLPDFVGRGLGGYMLSEAIIRAWGLRARRVWVHTCTLDSPAALPNYQARGFRIFDERKSSLHIPDHTLNIDLNAHNG